MAQDDLAAISDAELLDRTIALVDRLSLEHALGREDGGWTTSTIPIALQEGLGFRAGLDGTTAAIVVLTSCASCSSSASRSCSPTVADAPSGIVRCVEQQAFTFDPAAFGDELAAAASNVVVGSRLLYEDTRIRVWDIALEPGERLPFHRHRTSYFYRCHAGSLTRVRFPDGTGLVYESVADEVHHHEIGEHDLVVHDLENAGDSLLAFTTVELL